MKIWKLWVLEYVKDGRGNLHMLYCLDENEAMVKAHQICLENNVRMLDSRLTRFEHGFTIYRSTLPGTITTEDDEGPLH